MREINKDFFTGNRGEGGGGGEQTPLAHITKKGAVKRLDPSKRDVLLLGRRKTFIEEIHKFRESICSTERTTIFLDLVILSFCAEK